MFRGLYAVLGALIITGYGFVDWRGMELRTTKRTFVPQGLRAAAHGGYRSYWYGGFHGGK